MSVCPTCHQRFRRSRGYQVIGTETANCIVCNWPFERQARLKPRLYCSSKCDARDRVGWPLADAPDVVRARRVEAARPMRSRNDEIVRLYKLGNRTLESLGEQFHVTRERIRQIIKGSNVETES